MISEEYELEIQRQMKLRKVMVPQEPPLELMLEEQDLEIHKTTEAEKGGGTD